MKRIALHLALFTFALFKSAAWAAQTAQVIVPQANVYQYPQASSRVMTKLSQGDSVAVSNLPTEGFYKARLSNGDIGWISGNDILSSSGTPPQDGASAPVPFKSPEHHRRSRDSGDDSNPNSEDSFRALVGYGISSLSYSGITTYYQQTTGLNLGSNFGLELQFKMNRTLYWAARLEIISGNTGSQAISSIPQISQTTTVKEYSVEGGLMWSPITSHRFRLGFGAYLGIVPSATATIAQLNQSDNPNQLTQVVYQTAEVCGTLAVQTSIGLGDAFGIFLDAAYRYDQTGTSPPTTQIGNVPGIKINYSGITARVGMELRL